MTIQGTVAVACLLAMACGGTHSGRSGAPDTAAPTLPPPPVRGAVTFSLAIEPDKGARSLGVIDVYDARTGRPLGWCDRACTLTMDFGRAVRFEASPIAGWAFVGWKGGCGRSPVCEMTLTSSFSLSAEYALPTLQPGQVSVEGTGSIRAYFTYQTEPRHIDCSSSCEIEVDNATSVSVGASPADGWMFVGWGGDCAGSGLCEVRATGRFSVAARFAASPPRHAPRYTALDISRLAGEPTLPLVLGDDGSVAGLICRVPTHCDAFLWDGAVHRFPIPESLFVGVSGANGGRVAGTLFDWGTWAPRNAFVSQGDRLVEIGIPSAVWSMAHGLNSSGTVVGSYQTQSRDLHAFVWSNGVVRDLTEALGKPGSKAFAVDDAGTIAAIACDRLSREQESGTFFDKASGCRGVLLRDGVRTDLGPLPSDALVTSMSTAGQAVLGGVALWTAGSLLDPRPLIDPYAWPGIGWLAGGFSMEPFAMFPAVNASGDAVGNLSVPISEGAYATAVLLHSGQLYELGDRVLPTLRLHSAYAIDGQGRILARDSASASSQFFLLTPSE